MTPKIFSQTQEVLSHTVQRSFRGQMMHPHITSPHPPTFVCRNYKAADVRTREDVMGFFRIYYHFADRVGTYSHRTRTSESYAHVRIHSYEVSIVTLASRNVRVSTLCFKFEVL